MKRIELGERGCRFVANKDTLLAAAESFGCRGNFAAPFCSTFWPRSEDATFRDLEDVTILSSNGNSGKRSLTRASCSRNGLSERSSGKTLMILRWIAASAMKRTGL